MYNIKLFFLLIFVEIMLFGCKIRYSSDRELTHIRLKYSLPFEKKNGEIIYFSDSSDIIYYKDYTICVSSIKELAGKLKDSISEKIDTSYLVFKNNSKIGFFFPNYKEMKYDTMNVDTFFKEKYFGSTNFTITPNDSLVGCESEIDFLRKKFIPKIKFDETYCDSSIYEYTRDFPKINYSIANKMDTINGMKLYKIKYIYNSFKNDSLSTVRPSRYMLFILSNIEIGDSKDFISNINRMITAAYKP